MRTLELRGDNIRKEGLTEFKPGSQGSKSCGSHPTLGIALLSVVIIRAKFANTDFGNSP